MDLLPKVKVEAEEFSELKKPIELNQINETDEDTG